MRFTLTPMRPRPFRSTAVHGGDTPFYISTAIRYILVVPLHYLILFDSGWVFLNLFHSPVLRYVLLWVHILLPAWILLICILRAITCSFLVPLCVVLLDSSLPLLHYIVVRWCLRFLLPPTCCCCVVRSTTLFTHSTLRPAFLCSDFTTVHGVLLLWYGVLVQSRCSAICSCYSPHWPRIHRFGCLIDTLRFVLFYPRLHSTVDFYQSFVPVTVVVRSLTTTMHYYVLPIYSVYRWIFPPRYLLFDTILPFLIVISHRLFQCSRCSWRPFYLPFIPLPGFLMRYTCLPAYGLHDFADPLPMPAGIPLLTVRWFSYRVCDFVLFTYRSFHYTPFVLRLLFTVHCYVLRYDTPTFLFYLWSLLFAFRYLRSVVPHYVPFVCVTVLFVTVHLLMGAGDFHLFGSDFAFVPAILPFLHFEFYTTITTFTTDLFLFTTILRYNFLFGHSDIRYVYRLPLPCRYFIQVRTLPFHTFTLTGTVFLICSACYNFTGVSYVSRYHQWNLRLPLLPSITIFIRYYLFIPQNFLILFLLPITCRYVTGYRFPTTGTLPFTCTADNFLPTHLLFLFMGHSHVLRFYRSPLPTYILFDSFVTTADDLFVCSTVTLYILHSHRSGNFTVVPFHSIVWPTFCSFCSTVGHVYLLTWHIILGFHSVVVTFVLIPCSVLFGYDFLFYTFYLYSLFVVTILPLLFGGATLHCLLHSTLQLLPFTTVRLFVTWWYISSSTFVSCYHYRHYKFPQYRYGHVIPDTCYYWRYSHHPVVVHSGIPVHWASGSVFPFRYIRCILLTTVFSLPIPFIPTIDVTHAGHSIHYSIICPFVDHSSMPHSVLMTRYSIIIQVFHSLLIRLFICSDSIHWPSDNLLRPFNFTFDTDHGRYIINMMEEFQNHLITIITAIGELQEVIGPRYHGPIPPFWPDGEPDGKNYHSRNSDIRYLSHHLTDLHSYSKFYSGRYNRLVTYGVHPDSLIDPEVMI